MRGFYRNKYTIPDDSEVRYGASTQFEVIDEFLFIDLYNLFVFLAS